MTESERIVAAANAAVFKQADRYLSDVETTILLGAIANQTYEQIAASSNYSINYLKRDTGPKLWRLLSEALGEKISKTNFQVALSRYSVEVQTQPQPSPSAHCDWGAAPDVSFFLGRSTELDTLQQWIVGDACRLIALLGIGGIGKTSLAVKLAHQLQYEFDQIVWRSLRNAPPLETLLTELVPLLSGQTEYRPELDALLPTLRATKCLLVLDNLEAILQPESLGLFHPGYEEYGQLLQLVGDTAHTSCLVITSREKPEVIAAREGPALAVRTMILSGLQHEADELLTAKGLSGSIAERQNLIDIYGGNPLALKIVATSIQDLFDSNITTFLSQETVLFNGVRQLLDQQFARLSPLEQAMMYWLAINREWTGVEELQEDITPPVPRNRLLEGLEALCWSNLLEKQGGSYTQQPVVMEYVCDRLIEQIVLELTTAKLDLFTHYALVKTTVREYVRESQVRLLLEPIAREWQKTFRSISVLKQQVLNLLQTLQQIDNPLSNYGAGNLINLCLHLKLDLTDLDFSGLSIWHACLQQVELQGINFAHADLSKSLFTETFANILSVAFIRDGKLLASGDTLGNIYLRQMPSGQIVKIYLAHQSWVWSINFSPDAQTLASGSHDCTIKLWDISTGQCLNTFKHAAIADLAWSPDSTRLVSAGLDSTLRVWNVQTGECLKVLEVNIPRIASVAWSPDGRLLASPGGDNTVLLWDALAGERIKSLPNHTDLVWYVVFSPDGKTLASSSQDGTIKLWNVSTGKCNQTVRGNFGIVWWLAFSPNGRTLAGGCQDGTVRLWETFTGQCLKTLQGHTSLVWSVAFSPDGKTLASGSDDQTIKLWDTSRGDCWQTWHGYSNAIWDVDVSSDGQQLASAHQEGTIRLWDRKTGICLHTLRGHNSLVWSIAFSPDGKLLASASQDKTIRLWDLHTGQCLNVLEDHLVMIQDVTWNPNGLIFASASADGTVKIWNGYTGKCQKTLEHKLLVAAVAWNRAGQLLATGVQGGVVKLWDSDTGQCLKSLQGHTNTVYSVAFGLDGQILASGSHDNTVKLWDVETGECLYTLIDHIDWVWSVAWHPDWQILASASNDGTVRFWDVQTGECCQVLQGHSSGVRSLSWSPDGTWIATGSLDSTIKVWDTTTGDCLKTLRAKRPYEAMNLTGTTGLTPAQKVTLTALGAIDETVGR